MWSRGCVAFDSFGGFDDFGGSGGFLPAAMTADIDPRKTGLAPLPVLVVLTVLVWRHTCQRTLLLFYVLA